MELNAFLQPVGSPITVSTLTDGYEFDSNNERGAITASHIKNFSFNSGQGGTLNLGGTGNVSGLLSVNDASGSEIVRADKDGLTVKTLAGTTIIDGGGLISLANFPSESSVTTPATIFTTTSEVTVETLVFTLERSTLVLLLLTAQGLVYDETSDESWDGDGVLLIKEGANELARADIIGGGYFQCWKLFLFWIWSFPGECRFTLFSRIFSRRTYYYFKRIKIYRFWNNCKIPISYRKI